MRLPSSNTDLRQRWREGLPQAVEVALLLLLAVQAARLVWMLALPPAPFGDAAAEPPATVAPIALRLSGDPFFRIATSPQARDAALGYRLFAVRGEPDGGAAIVAGKDGIQTAYRVGDEVADGIVLQAVGADHATLRAGGGDHRLSLPTDLPPAAPNPNPRRAAALPSARPAAADAGIDAQQLLQQAGLRPRNEGGRVTGYSVIPRGDGALLRQAGLQSGDVLLSVNGQALTPERYRALAEELAGERQITLTYQRGGETRSTTLQAKTP